MHVFEAYKEKILVNYCMSDPGTYLTTDRFATYHMYPVTTNLEGMYCFLDILTTGVSKFDIQKGRVTTANRVKYVTSPLINFNLRVCC